MSLGKKLKERRAVAKLTLTEAGEIFGVSYNTVYRWEHDMCIPRRPTLKKLSEVYGVPYHRLLAGIADNTDGCDNLLIPETAVEKKIMEKLKTMSFDDRNKVLKYVDFICVNDDTDE